MKTDSKMSPAAVRTDEVRLDRLLGRQVRAADGTPAGRLEEFRAEERGAGYVITEYVLGAGGLLERLGVLVQRVVGRGGGGYVARWDQIDISDPDHPRLKCPVGDLQKV